MNSSVLAKQDKDGGYYAIKGFLYQFDRTLIEIFSNLGVKVNFECQQDIDYDDYVIQVKHKEAANFSNSKIRQAVNQLIGLYKLNNEKKFRLYCHFKDRFPQRGQKQLVESMDLEQLNEILGKYANEYEPQLKEEFIENFELVFLPDFYKTFRELIELIKKVYELDTDELAIYYHAIFQTELSQLAIQSRVMRNLSSEDLDEKIKSNNKIIFFSGYKNYLSEEKYIKFIKSEYFTHKKPYIIPHERIFIIECPHDCSKEVLIDIIYKLSSKFFRNEKTGSGSPSPFICFRNLESEILNQIKRTLLDDEFYFNDGTYFNGDKVRFENLCNKQESKVQVRFINEENLIELSQLKSIETYQFFIKDAIKVPYKSREIGIAINNIENIMKITS